MFHQSISNLFHVLLSDQFETHVEHKIHITRIGSTSFVHENRSRWHGSLSIDCQVFRLDKQTAGQVVVWGSYLNYN